jgi:hypothetical protein
MSACIVHLPARVVVPSVLERKLSCHLPLHCSFVLTGTSAAIASQLLPLCFSTGGVGGGRRAMPMSNWVANRSNKREQLILMSSEILVSILYLLIVHQSHGTSTASSIRS